MYSDTRADSPSVSEPVEVFRSLNLGGVRGRVRATLSDTQLCFESRTGQALDMRLEAIQRVQHHHTTLIPAWLGFVGLLLCWLSWRGLEGKLQSLIGSAGIVIAVSHFITRRQTLTIDTSAGDCHSVFGNDDSLIRLCAMVNRMQDGLSLEEARESISSLIRDSDYPRHRNFEQILTAPEVIELEPAPVLTSFLDSMSFDEQEPLDATILDEPIAMVADLDLPIWADEIVQEPEMEVPASLLTRARGNLHTQRNNAIQNGWQPQMQQPSPQTIHRNQPVDHSSYGMMQFNGAIPAEHVPMHATPPPTQFLPSFFGAEGAHVPGTMVEEFQSPDTPLIDPQLEEPTQSLVAATRKEESQTGSENNIAEPVEGPAERYPSISRLSVKGNSKRRILTGGRRGTALRGSSVVRELVGPSLERVSERVSNISRSLLRRSRTTDALRIQADHARQATESIQNLAQSRGGVVNDEKVEEMLSHIRAEAAIPSSFDEMMSTEEKQQLEAEGVSALPRLDS